MRRREPDCRTGRVAGDIHSSSALDWVAAMITPTMVAVVLGGVAVMPGGWVYWVLLALTLHIPPSAVSLVGDVRFCWSVQRLVQLT